MDLLPIESLLDEDAPLVGSDVINLAKLHRSKIPIVSGIVIFPPEFKFQSILEYYQINEKEVFEQKLSFIKEEVLKIPLPQDIEKALSQKKINPQVLWHHLLENWLNQIRSRLWREGLGQGLNKALVAQTVFFTKKVSASGRAYFDFDQKKTVVEQHSGTISDKQIEELNELVKKANKILVFPHVYDWVIEKKDLKLVKIVPFTQYPQKTDDNPLVVLSHKNNDPHLKRTLKTAIKIYLQMDASFRISKEVDGCIILGENLQELDTKIVQIIEAATSFPHNPTIFRFSDIKDKENVRGILRLIHQDSLLKQDVEVLQFVREKKNLPVHLGIPMARSVEELTLFLDKLEKMGVKKGGNLHYWLEVTTPENLLNIDQYLAVGLDGVILNLDEVSAYLGGLVQTAEEKVFYASQIDGVLKLLAGSLGFIHQAKKPILTVGSFAMQPEILHFLLKNGLWAVSVDYQHSLGIQEYMRFVERNIVSRVYKNNLET